MMLAGCGETKNSTSLELDTSVNTEQKQLIDDNAKDTVDHMPLNLDMVRYAGHEFYWDGWNAFVINYIDSDISPYQVVHIGEIKDKSICNILADGADTFKIERAAPYPAYYFKLGK